MTNEPASMDNKTLGASKPTEIINPAVLDAPHGHASGEAVGDKPTVVQQPPEDSKSSAVPGAPAASEPASTAAVDGQTNEAVEPSVAAPSSADARQTENPTTAVSEPPQAASIPATAEPLQNDISQGAPLVQASTKESPAAATNGKAADEDNDISALAVSGAAQDTKMTDAPPPAEGGESRPSVGDKRKADELAKAPAPAVEPASNGPPATTDTEKPQSDEPVAKKPKSSEASEAADSGVKKDADTPQPVANGDAPKKGASRGKKDKKPVAPAPVGRTARKTRSQGLLES